MDVVNVVLEKSKKLKELKSTTVEKHLELEYDLGNLLAFDENELNAAKLKSNPNAYLKALARDNTQLLFNKIWELPIQKIDDITKVTLPKPQYVLPRALPVPIPRGPTKWEKFAKEKGIVKKKKDKLKWDDILKKWVPLYGYKRAEAERAKEWVLEVPGNADPYEDQFNKKAEEKSEKVAKNEFQRLRNLAKAKNVNVPRLGFTPTEKPSSTALGAAVTVAKASTASLGKFQKNLPKEKPTRNVKPLLPGSNKRKLPVPNVQEEVKSNLNLIDNILNKKPKLNIEKVVEKEVHAQNKEEEHKKQKPKKKNSGRKTKKGAKGGKFRGPKPKGAIEPTGKKGKPMTAGKMKPKQHVGGKVKGGRKRR
ncbi:hypothetical protein RUM43_004545 [Polyplax serrata]|uniref:Ribosome biogenesis regulatory protein n=1 Tax=Polyplax serrata TaxID=468196 RepID=A0AAN8SC56_POLSC